MEKCAKVCLVSEDRNPSLNQLPLLRSEYNFLLPPKHPDIHKVQHPIFFERSAKKHDDKGVSRKIILPICCINGMLDESFERDLSTLRLAGEIAYALTGSGSRCIR